MSLWLRDRPIDGLALIRHDPLPVHTELYEFVSDAVRRRLQSPGEDFISRFALANQRRKRMSRGTLVWNLVDIILYGYPSIQSAIALAVSAFAGHPDSSPLVPSANRDERIWDQPDEFVIRRPREPPHLTFGAGIHQTPGAPLARMVLTNCLVVLGASLCRIVRQAESEFWPANAAEVQVEALPVAFEFKGA